MKKKLTTCFLAAAMALTAATTAAQVVDEHGIITAPADGKRQVYTRSGMTFSNTDNQFSAEQSGSVHIVTCDDGTVYIRNILSSYPTGTWVKGTLDLDAATITVPAQQPVYYNSSAGTTLSVRWGINENDTYYNYEIDADNFVFDYDAQNSTISLRSSSEQLFMGLFWDDDNYFAWTGDKETVWRYQADYTPMEVVSVTAPATLTTETWYVSGRTMDSNGKARTFRSTATVGFDGNDVYLKGVFTDFPDAWMKGQRDGTDITFHGLQTLGTLADYTIYAVGTDGADLLDFHLDYDEDNGKMHATNELLANADKQELRAAVRITSISITREDPYKPIDVLPYENTFDEEGFDWFTVVDANADGITWEQEDDAAVNKYNVEMAADDWLISPAFNLQADKHYKLDIDTRCSSNSYPERIEVKMGTGATAEDMTQQVIEATIVDDEQGVTLSGKDITVAATGTYYFGIHAISDADMASLKVSRFTLTEVNVNAPAAPTALTVTPDDEALAAYISFTTPTTTIGGQPLSGSLYVQIMRNGAVITTFTDVAPGTPLTYTDDEGLTPGNHTYTVVAYNTEGQGESASAVAHITAVFDIPFVADFSQDGTFGLFTTINANEDARYWEDNVHYAAYEYSSDNAADDHLVTPLLHMEAGKRYNIIVRAEAAGNFLERFEVLVGKKASVEDLTTKVIENAELNGEEPAPVDFEGVFACEETGNYNVSIHCISDADMYALWIHKLTVELAPELTAPAAPELSVTPDANGAKQAVVNITAPTTDNAGQALKANLTKVELMRDGVLVHTFEDVAPGTSLTWTDTDFEESGAHSYQAIPYNADGIGTKSETVSAYVGFDIPAQVENFTATAQQDKVVFTWDKVSTGRNGGVVNASEIEYLIYECETGTTMLIDQPVAVVKDADSYTLDFDTNVGEQNFKMWYIAARNEAGESYLNEEAADLLIGAPYELPFVEGWATGNNYWDTNSYALSYSVDSDGDGAAVAMTAQEPDTDVFMLSGKIDLTNASNPVLLFDAAGFGVSSVTIIGAIDGADEAVELGTFSVGSEDYSTIKVPLSQLKGGSYARFGISTHIQNATYYDWWNDEMIYGDAFVIDNIRVFDQFANNLGIELTAAETVQAGYTTDVVATVTNWGENVASGYTVTIKAGDKVLSQQTVEEQLQPYAKNTITAQMETTVFNEMEDVVLTATVDYAADQNLDDNKAETVIAVTEPIAPAPETLTAEVKDDGAVLLTWTAPTTTATFTEGFEGGLGGWSTVDSDKDGNAWLYSNNATSNVIMATNSGQCSVYSESYSNESNKALTPDNWLISPRIALNGTFAFYAMGQDENYCEEHFAILVSTSDDPTDLDAYQQVSEELVTTADMMEYSVDLSEYAGKMGYVAIRHYNVTDQFVLVVDDITYSLGGQPKEYIIYIDGQQENAVAGDVTTFTLEAGEVSEGDHTFAVTAIYDNEQQSKPATASINVTTAIEQIAGNAAPSDVYTTDGKLVRRQAKTLRGLRGVFVVNGKTVMAK